MKQTSFCGGSSNRGGTAAGSNIDHRSPKAERNKASLSSFKDVKSRGNHTNVENRNSQKNFVKKQSNDESDFIISLK